MPYENPAEMIEKVRACPNFRTFSAAIGARVDDGNTRDAAFMLVDVGAPWKLAWQIVADWPYDDDFGQHAADVRFRTRHEKGAVRLAHFIPEFAENEWNWEALLSRSLRRLKLFKGIRDSPETDSGSTAAEDEE